MKLQLVNIINLLLEIGMIHSKSEGQRLLKQGAIKIGDGKINSPFVFADIESTPVTFYFKGER